MTEQLFKAFDNDKKEWIPSNDFYVDSAGNIHYLSSVIVEDHVQMIHIKNAILVLATGLKDKHGRMIFDKDILRINYLFDAYRFEGIYQVNIGYRGVEFRFVKLSWKDLGKNQYPLITNQYPLITTISSQSLHDRWANINHAIVFIRPSGLGEDAVIVSDIEIIGDIFDNPELLEVVKNA